MNTDRDAKFRNVRLFIFDLDGTLIDSERDLALSVNAMLRRAKRAELPEPVIASYVGNGVAALVERALGAGTPRAEVEDAIAYFLEYYRDHMLDNTAAYPGVEDTLESLSQLPGARLAVLTNKPVNFSRQIIAGLRLERYFSHVYGGNSFDHKKPHPFGIVRLMEQNNVLPGQTLMIGDSSTDVETGRNAGVLTCGVSYGIGSPTLASTPPDVLLDDFRKLAPLCSPAETASALR